MSERKELKLDLDATDGGKVAFAVALLVIFFSGEPDLVDALIHFFMASCR